MSEAHAIFRDVQKSYDGKTMVVKKLNLSVEKGEFLTMLGPSGSGKTTCLMMLAGFETVTSGDILIHGNSVSRIPPHQRGIGMVFQNYALFPHMTVEENLAFPLQVRRMSKDEIREKVERVLDMVCLSEFANRHPNQLSGGQQQRVAVARALVFSPDLVLMDEPLGALDKNLREQMQYELKHIHEQLGVTVVYVTHDQSEALTMSDRVAVFNNGIIQQLAPPDELYEFPANAFVANFIGENNRLLGVVEEAGDGTCAVTVAGEKITARRAQAERGERVLLSLRPERIHVLTNDAAANEVAANEAAENRFNAKIQEKIYLGDHIRLRFQLLDTDEFIVKVPNNGQFASLKVDEDVPIGWRTADCQALDVDERG